MDGNGRWAKRKGLPRVAGHKAGAKRASEIIETAIKLKIKYLTLFAFSSENWNRPKSEVSDLMKLLKSYLNHELDDNIKNNVILRIIGNRKRLSKNITKKIQQIEQSTMNNKGLNLTIALDYGGREDILYALKKIILNNDVKTIKNIDIKDISTNLMTSFLPDPDLIIRSSGEIRISNFFLWQSAYSEFIFVKCFWPDFNEKKFIECLLRYSNRERRYGKISE